MARCDSCGRDKETVEHNGRQLCLMCLSRHGVPEAPVRSTTVPISKRKRRRDTVLEGPQAIDRARAYLRDHGRTPLKKQDYEALIEGGLLTTFCIPKAGWREIVGFEPDKDCYVEVRFVQGFVPFPSVVARVLVGLDAEENVLHVEWYPDIDRIDGIGNLPELCIDNCARVLRDFVENCSCGIQGPHEIAYGIGWSPSISYWIGKRRVHLYADLCAESSLESFALEIADIGDEGRVVQRCHVTSVEQIRIIMNRFLCNHCSIDALSDYEWIRDKGDHDKSIPDPPNRQNPASFAGMAGGHFVPGGPPRRTSSHRGPIEVRHVGGRSGTSTARGEGARPWRSSGGAVPEGDIDLRKLPLGWQVIVFGSAGALVSWLAWHVGGLLVQLAVAAVSGYEIGERSASTLAILPVIAASLCAFAMIRRAKAKLVAERRNSSDGAVREVARTDAWACMDRGIAYLRNGDHEHAIAAFSEAIEFRPGLAEAYSSRGDAYRRKGDLDRAIADCTKAIEFEPDLVGAYNNRGFAYGQKGDWLRQMADYTKAIQFRPDHPQAYYNRGVAYAQKGDYDLARSDFERAAALDPRGPIGQAARQALRAMEGR